MDQTNIPFFTDEQQQAIPIQREFQTTDGCRNNCRELWEELRRVRDHASRQCQYLLFFLLCVSIVVAFIISVFYGIGQPSLHVSFESSVTNTSLVVIDHTRQELMFNLHFKLKSLSPTCKNKDLSLQISLVESGRITDDIFDSIVSALQQNKWNTVHNTIVFDKSKDVVLYGKNLRFQCVFRCRNHYVTIDDFHVYVANHEHHK